MKTQNLNLTKHCRHGQDGMCDYCLVAYGQHGEDEKRGKKGRKSHSIEGKRYACGECMPTTYPAVVHGRNVRVTIPEKWQD